MDSKDPTPLSLCACTCAISGAKRWGVGTMKIWQFPKIGDPNIDPNML